MTVGEDDFVIPPAPPVIEVPGHIVHLDRVVWFRTDLNGRWDLVVDREEQAKILGTTPALVSARRSNYIKEYPRAVVKYGTREWVLRAKMEEFADWYEEQRNKSAGKNQGRKVERTVSEKADAEMVRLNRRLETLTEHKGALVIRLREKNAEIASVKTRITAQQEKLELLRKEKAIRLAEQRKKLEAEERELGL